MLPDEPRRDEPVGSEPGQGHEAAGLLTRLRRCVEGARAWFHTRPGGRQIWRGAVALFGLVVIVVGIVLLAVPGPGWLVIFLGLGIWATEFAWAKTLLKFVRRNVGRWTAWLGRQPRWLGRLVGAAGLIALGTAAWLLLAN